MAEDDRYDYVMDPMDTWTVWDLMKDEPAFFGDRVLAGLSKLEAEAACEVMNDAWRKLKKKSDVA
jgi:hypothetical protein